MTPAVLLVAATLAQAPQAGATTPAQQPSAPARAQDVASVEAIVGALYDTISGPAGQKRDWDRMRSLFLPEGRLIASATRPDGSRVHRVMDVQGYIDRSGPSLEKSGFFEREIARRLDQFGSIAHAFSTYESRRAMADAQPFARGINSIQLLNDGKRWWIVTVLWDSEGKDSPIPAQYLPR